jgi:DNA (cytosine-5)-methyltransferase 1
MTVLELFAGAGGAYLGLRAAGLHCLCAVELDASAAAALRAAGAPALRADVRDLAAIGVALGGRRPDGIWASFPCQCWSAAGKRLGARDARNGWPWTVAAIDELGPRWVLCENVAGLTHHRSGCTGRCGQQGLFGAVDPLDCPGCYLERVILPDLRKRFAHAGYFMVDAADFGVPQHRRRLILWAGPSPMVAPVGSYGTDRRPWVSMRTALGPGEERVLRVATAHGPGERVEERRLDDYTDRPAPTISAGHAEPIVNVKARGEIEAELAAAEQVVYPAGCGRAATEPWRLDSPAPAVTAAEVRGTRASPASGFDFNGGPDRASDAAFLASGRRRLTVEECAVLQGFPGGHPFTGTVEDRYKQVGNAVPPALAEAVGRAAMAAWEVTR